VSVRYEPDGPAVLDGLTLDIAPGERVALLGLNGSGKTTLLLAVAGLVPHGGEIRVGGLSLGRRTLTEVRKGLGFLFNVPEDQLLFPRVIDDTAFGLRRRGVPAPEAAAAALAVLGDLGVGHLAGAPLHHLSHGQKQRVALAGALVTGPSLLLLDEPSAGLDPPGKRSLAGTLRALPAALLVATHDLAFASRLVDRYLLLDGGRVVEDTADASRIERRWDGPDGPVG
jgi:cobalt/nickel transport system ATP-binding protein